MTGRLARRLLLYEFVRRFSIGLFFVLHGLAHAVVGTRAQDVPGGLALGLGAEAHVLLATALFAIAMPGLVAAGFGVWGVAGLERLWRLSARVGVAASALLLALFASRIAEIGAGLVIDVLSLVIAARHVPRTAEHEGSTLGSLS